MGKPTSVLHEAKLSSRYTVEFSLQGYPPMFKVEWSPHTPRDGLTASELANYRKARDCAVRRFEKQAGMPPGSFLMVEI